MITTYFELRPLFSGRRASGTRMEKPHNSRRSIQRRRSVHSGAGPGAILERELARPKAFANLPSTNFCSKQNTVRPHREFNTLRTGRNKSCAVHDTEFCRIETTDPPATHSFSLPSIATASSSAEPSSSIPSRRQWIKQIYLRC